MLTFERFRVVGFGKMVAQAPTFRAVGLGKTVAQASTFRAVGLGKMVAQALACEVRGCGPNRRGRHDSFEDERQDDARFNAVKCKK
jgi:hypothetical protein